MTTDKLKFSHSQDNATQPEVEQELTAAPTAQPEPECVADAQDEVNAEQPLSVEQDLLAKIATLEEALARSEAQIREQQDSVLRARADVDNMRRRSEQEVDKARKFALERFAGELLPVIDNLERALEVGDLQNEALKPMQEGVALTLKTMLSVVQKFGLKVIDPHGEPFNPDWHQAMSIQESAEHAPNTVMLVMQKGYELNGRVLRPAMVMVSKASSASVNVSV
ncbi:MAG: nucleotide exchange factor GrpE [Vibrionaceae bacterium]